MPAKIRKIKSGKYSVRTPGGTKSKGTTKSKAKRQQRLLNAIDHDPSFAAKVKRGVMGKY